MRASPGAAKGVQSCPYILPLYLVQAGSAKAETPLRSLCAIATENQGHSYRFADDWLDCNREPGAFL